MNTKTERYGMAITPLFQPDSDKLNKELAAGWKVEQMIAFGPDRRHLFVILSREIPDHIKNALA